MCFMSLNCLVDTWIKNSHAMFDFESVNKDGHETQEHGESINKEFF